jgi:serine/threonine protein kinase
MEDKADVEELLAKTTTQMYRAPEMIDLYMREELTEKTDIWALGCIFYSICFLSHPFQDCGSLGILNAKINIPKYTHIPPEAQTLLMRMLDFDPEARPSIREIFQYLRALAKGDPVPDLPLSEDAVAQKQRRRDAELRREQKALKKVKTPVVPARAPQAAHLDPGSVAAKRLAMKKGLRLPDESFSTSDASFAVDFDAAPVQPLETFEAFEDINTFDPFQTSTQTAVDPFGSNVSIPPKDFEFDAFSVSAGEPEMVSADDRSDGFTTFEASSTDPFQQPVSNAGFDAFESRDSESANNDTFIPSSAIPSHHTDSDVFLPVKQQHQLDEAEIDVMDLFDTGISGIKSSVTFAPPISLSLTKSIAGQEDLLDAPKFDTTPVPSRSNSITGTNVDLVNQPVCVSSSNGNQLDLLDMDSSTVQSSSSQKSWDMLSELIDALPNTHTSGKSGNTTSAPAIDVMKLFDESKQGVPPSQQNIMYANNSGVPISTPSIGNATFQSPPPPPPPLHVVMAGRSIGGIKTSKPVDPFDALKMSSPSARK